MRLAQEPKAPPGASILTSDILAYARVHALPGEVALLRRKPGPGRGESLPPNFLKHSDEQTITGLAAVLKAIHACSLGGTDFTAWGVVAGTCFIGRSAIAGAVQRFAEEGAWGISPHIIPHRSQHAVSGTLSQALSIHGPNFGTGGGPGRVPEALVAAHVLLHAPPLPGVWTLISGWDPEFVPDRSGQPVTPAVCHAVALALVPARVDSGLPSIRVGGGHQAGQDKDASLSTVTELEIILDSLAHSDANPVRVTCAGGLSIEMHPGQIHPATTSLHSSHATNGPRVCRVPTLVENSR